MRDWDTCTIFVNETLKEFDLFVQSRSDAYSPLKERESEPIESVLLLFSPQMDTQNEGQGLKLTSEPPHSAARPSNHCCCCDGSMPATWPPIATAVPVG